MSSYLDNIIATGLLLVIVVAALAHGVVEPWSALLFKWGLIALVLLWMVKAAVERQLTVVIPSIAWPLAALLALGIAQSLAITDSAGARQSLSLDVEATREVTLMLGGLLAGTLVAANFLTSRARLRSLARFLTIYGLALAFFAIIQHFTWQEHFYWLRPAITDSPFGPFVNRNHFAGYLALLLPWPVALLLERRTSLAERLFYLFAAAWLGAAVIVSLSRGGMISIFAELMLMAALGARLARHETEPSAEVGASWRGKLLRWGAVTGLVAAILGGALWLGEERVINRLATGQETAQPAAAQTFTASRGEIWRDTWAVIRAHAWTGAGLGAFETAYPIHSQDQGMGRVLAHAHNDYLQVLADGGIIGGALALWFIILTWRAIALGVRAREPQLAAVALASGASICGLLVHSLFDFNLQLPAHALLFLSLAAVVCRTSALAVASAPQPQMAPRAQERVSPASALAQEN